MAKKTPNRVLTDAAREIRHTFSRFLSLMVLSALAVCFLSGLRATAPDMKLTADRYFDQQNLMDIRVLSTLGLTDDDIAALAAQEGVCSAQGAYTVDAILPLGDKDFIVKAISLSDAVNIPRLVEGRMPQKADECLAEPLLLKESGLAIGDTITLNTGTGTFEGALAGERFTIVGTADSPLYIGIERGSSTLGTGKVAAYLILPEAAFSMDYYTDAYLRLDGAAELMTYSDGYEDLVDRWVDEREDFADRQAQLRYQSVLDEANDKLDDAQRELDDAKIEVRQELADAWQELEDGRKELDDGWAEYRDGVQELDDQVAEAEAEIADGEAELADALLELEDAQRELDEAKQELDDARKELDDGWAEYNEGWADYQQGVIDYEDGLQKYKDGVASYEDGLKQYQDGLAEYHSGKAALSSAYSQLQSGEAEYNAGKSQYDAGLAQFNTLTATLADQLSDAFGVEMTADELLAALQLEAAADPPGGAVTTAADAALTGTQSALSAQRNSLQSALGSIDALEGQLALLDPNSEDPAVLAQIAGLQEQLAALDSALGMSRAEARTTLNSLNAALENFPTNSAALLTTKNTLETSAAQLAAARAQLDSGWSQYHSGAAALSSGWSKLSEAKRELNAAKQELEEAWTELEDAKQQLEEADTELIDALTELEEGERELADGWVDYEDGLKQLADGRAEYEDGLRELEDARDTLAREVRDANRDLADALRELNDGEQDYADGLVDYADGQKEAEERIADAEQELADARAEVADIDECEWYVLTRSTNAGYLSYSMDADRMGNLATVFPLIFFLVAALVCLTTMTRMVEEQRISIGGMKAMGFSRGAIAVKYVGYGFLASTLGSLIGLAIGLTLLPWIICTAWGILYTTGDIYYSAEPLTSALACLAAIGTVTLSALAACFSTLSAVPAQLMRPKAPPAGKRVLLERITPLWRRLSFHYKVTIRNLFRYQKRFWMTVVGIGGCAALIVTAFGLRDSIFDVMDRQYDEIYRYSAQIGLVDKITPGELDEVAALLSDSPLVDDWLPCRSESVTAETASYTVDATLQVVDGQEELERFVNLRHRTDGGTVTLTDDSVILTEKLASLLDLSPGDSLTLDGEKRVTVTVSDITEHYIQHFIYMTSDCYQALFGSTPKDNLVLLAYPAESDEAQELNAQLVALDGVTSLSLISDTRKAFTSSLESVDYAVILIIVCAAALAFVVLFNLTNINITERMRELATLKVLGFYDGELSAYVYRENVILTVFGVALGMLMGKLLHQWLILTVEIDMLMFGRFLKAPSYGWAILLTVIFSLLVNLAAHWKLKKLDMVESLKSVE